MKRFDFNSFKENLKGSFSKNTLSDKSFKFGGYSVFSGIIVLCIAVFVILASEAISSKYTKIDLTADKLFTLSEESENIVKALDKDVQIYFITQNGSENEQLKNILEKYDDLSDKISVTVKDPAVEPNFTKEYTSEEVHLNTVIVESGAKSKYISIDELYSEEIDYETYSTKTSFIGENSITSAITYVSSDKLPKIYITTNHGEEKFGNTITEALKHDNVETEEITLVTAQNIPEDADCIVIYEPEIDISQEEKNILLDYLKNGGNLIVYSGYSGYEMPVLNELMENYGVTSENTAIFEGDSSRCIDYYGIGFIPEMAEHEITNPLIEANYPVLVSNVKPITLTYSEKDTTKITQILKTSAYAYNESESDTERQFTVGTAITDTTDNGEAHILWITSDMLNEQINSYVSGLNHDLFLNTINWMSGREESITIHPKTLENEYLQINSFASTFWSIILVFVIPVIVLAIGIYVWMRRKSR